MHSAKTRLVNVTYIAKYFVVAVDLIYLYYRCMHDDGINKFSCELISFVVQNYNTEYFIEKLSNFRNITKDISLWVHK